MGLNINKGKTKYMEITAKPTKSKYLGLIWEIKGIQISRNYDLW
jgi:hypothetical protein